MPKMVRFHSFVCLIFIFVKFLPIYMCEKNDYNINWKKFESYYRDHVNYMVKSHESLFFGALKHTNTSTNCKNSLISFKDSLLNFDSDAIKMYDSWGKLPIDIFSGGFINLGSYRQCKNIRKSQYCMLKLTLPVPYNRWEGLMSLPISLDHSLPIGKNFLRYFSILGFNNGLCLPDVCNKGELSDIFKYIFANLDTGLLASIEYCDNFPSIVLTAKEIISFIFIAIVILLSIYGTYVAKESVFSSFNFIDNCYILLKKPTSKANDCIAFLKTFCLFLVITSHYFIYLKFKRYFDVPTKLISFYSFPLFLSPYTVDAFFVISALFTVKAILEKKYKFTLLNYIFLRWLRTAPTIAFTLALQFILLSPLAKYYFGGPFWNSLAPITINICSYTWWRNILQIEYLFPQPLSLDFCLSVDWYLDADLIYHLIFITISILILKKKMKLAVILTSNIVIIGVLITAIIMHNYDVDPILAIGNSYGHQFIKYLTYIHYRPWGHLSSFFIGVLLAFILDLKTIQITKKIAIFLWLSIITIFTFIMFMEYRINYGTKDPRFIQIMYGSTSKTLWSIAISLFIALAYWDYVSLNKFSHVFHTLSRFNLTALCIHFPLIKFFILMDEELATASFFHILPQIIFIYVLSFFICALIEVPTINIIKRFCKPEVKQE